ncbi:MAG: flagellar basal body P-ring formation chaperone FlgA [Planctomycetaceae bacterium]|nr:flagellar basal body P-ring formation chaperone FlgA [Planctomycetaceae bacterium]
MNRTSIIVWMGLIAAASGTGQGLRIYLPSERSVESQTLRLDQVAMVLGDQPLAERAGAVSVGQFAAAGQQLTIDRKTVLSCLASTGIKASQVQFNGAEAVRVRRAEQTVTADRFLQMAQDFLQTQSAGEKAAFKPVRPARDLVLPAAAAAELTPRFSDRQTQGVRRVTVSVSQNGSQVGSQELVFAAEYERRRVVAATALEAGTAVTSENTKIEPYLSNQPSDEEMFIPYGMITRKKIDAGMVVERSAVQPKEAPVAVKRQQQVILKIENECLLVSAYGEAMEEGKVGDLIRVKRGSRATQDERFVIGRIMEDGTIKPTLN